MTDKNEMPVCAVVGVGPGNGEAFARRFAADGYAVALMARRTEPSASLAAELPHAKAYPCDVAEAASVEAAFAAMRADLGDADVLIYNAGSGDIGPSTPTPLALDLSWFWAPTKSRTAGRFFALRIGGVH